MSVPWLDIKNFFRKNFNYSFDAMDLQIILDVEMRRVILILFLNLCCACGALGANIDHQIADYIRDNYNSKSLNFAMQGVTTFGDAEFLASFCVGLTLFSDEEGEEVGRLASISLAGCGAVDVAIKMITNRKRPNNADCPRYRSSFPSGHTAGAFALAYVIGHEYEHLKIPAYIIAAGVAISRMFLQKHYLSDVVLGAGVGVASGMITIRLEDKIGEMFKLWGLKYHQSQDE